MLISDKMDFKRRDKKRDKEGHFIMIKGSIQHEDISFVNICTPNVGAPKYIKQILTNMNVNIDSNTVTAIIGLLGQTENQQGNSVLK